MEGVAVGRASLARSTRAKRQAEPPRVTAGPMEGTRLRLHAYLDRTGGKQSTRTVYTVCSTTVLGTEESEESAVGVTVYFYY